MESHEYHWARAVLAWQIELGADEAICDKPVNRYELPESQSKPGQKRAKSVEIPEKPPEIDAVAVARNLAAQAQNLAELEQALVAFELCELKKGARNTVFGAGKAGADVMVICDAPSKEDDRAGQFLSGPAGQLFDKMFRAIGLSRDAQTPEIYLSYATPWRPPQDRDLRANELAMLRPFVERQIEFVAPKVLVLMGNASCQMLLEKRGVTRLRGTWHQLKGRKALPMLPLGQLMRTPLAKRDAWSDLLAIKARLKNEAASDNTA